MLLVFANLFAQNIYNVNCHKVNKRREEKGTSEPKEDKREEGDTVRKRREGK